MSIRKRGNKYYFAVTVMDEFGNKKRIERVGGTTKAAARAAAQRFLRQNTDYYGRYDQPERMHFDEFWEIFLREYADKNLKPATIRTYEQAGRNHILPIFGDMAMCDITFRIVQAFINKKHDHDKLSHGTVTLLLAVLKKSLSYAVLCNILHVNPADNVRLPRRLIPAAPAHVFTPNEIQVLFSRFPVGHPIHTPLTLSYHTGMRLGECLALRWRDISFEEGYININSTLFDDHGQSTRQESPKTASSVRRVPLCDSLSKDLKEVRHNQRLVFMSIGKRWNESVPVCTTDKGRQMTSYSMRHFEQFCKQEFGSGSFHSLRHTHATMLLEAGESLEEVSKHLGHSSVTTTSKIYSHYTAARRKNIARVIDKIFDMRQVERQANCKNAMKP